MKSLTAIANDPDISVEITDNKEAKAVLLKLGLIQHFSRDTGFPNAQMLAHDGLKTHLLAAVLFQGHKKKKDNGFIVYLLPRSGFDDPRANHTMIKNMKEDFESKGMRATILNANIDPSKN